MAPKLRSTRIVRPLLLLAFATCAAAADEPNDAPKPGAQVTVDRERVRCMDANKVIRCNEGSKTHVVVEKSVSVNLEVKQKPTGACAATVDFEYQQRNTVAHVVGIIENAQCAASSGDYVLAVTIRDAKGEVSTLEFPQEWARTDAASVKFTHDLPIGPNADLQNVRTRRLRCMCAEQPEPAVPAEKP